MCDPVTAMTVATVASGGISALGQWQQGQAASRVASNNAKMAEYQAQDAVDRGEREAMAVRRRAAQIKGSQRAMMAARGLDLTSGTPADILDSTDFFGELDANTVRFNASRDAWSSRVDASNMRAQGKAARRQANMGALGTILGTAGAVSDRWYPKPSGGGYGPPGAT